MTDRPISFMTKAMRKEAALIGGPELLQHYEDVYASRFVWEGGPEDMPSDFPERCLFRSGLIGPAKAFGSMQITEGSPSLLGIYGQPLQWMPTTYNGQIPPGWETPSSERPLWLNHIPSQEMLPLCELMATAWRCMNTSLISMSQPIVLQGTAGAEVNIQEADNAIAGFKPVIPTLDRNAVTASVLDLGGHDYTTSLISAINAIDCEILARMGIKSAGTEKASGVTREETLSIGQELKLILQRELDKRRAWCAKVQDLLPGLTVRPADGLMEETVTGENDEKDPAEGDAEGAAGGNADDSDQETEG